MENKKWVVQYREIIMRSLSGKRIRAIVKDNFTTWHEYDDLASNLIACNRYLTADVLERHLSYTVHVQLIRGGTPTQDRLRVTQIKWGMNNKLYFKLDYPTLSAIREGEAANV